MEMPEVYKNWVLANPDDKRTTAFFFEAAKSVQEILKYVCNPTLFIMADPAFLTRQLIDILEYTLKAAEFTTTPDKDLTIVPIKKFMIFSA
jgi:hypothetical protein